MRFARVWTGICLISATALLALNLFGAQGRAPLVEGEAEVASDRVLVASVVGKAEVRHVGQQWVSLEPGAKLTEGDMVRTADFSQVILRPRQGATLTLTPNTNFTIGDETPEISRFTLGTGRVAADVERRRRRTFEFDSVAGGARADTTGGEFNLVADGDGLLGVVTRRGEVGLTAEGRRVVVPAGRQAVALPGRPPGEPLAIPKEVFLQVHWPAEGTRASSVKVSGRTDVGVRVRLGKTVTPVGYDGRFELEVPLTEGENRLRLLAEDGAGNVEISESPLLVREASPRRKPLQLKVEKSVWE